MPVAKGAALDPAQTRTALLDAATRLFYERGLDGIGIADLCAAVGSSKETLYRHFGSKDGLVQAVLERRSDRVTNWLRSAAEDAGDDPFARLDAVFAALATWYAEPGFRGCAILNAAAQRHEDPARTVAARHLDRRLELLTDIAQAAGAADPAETGRQLLMLVAGATALADHRGDPTAAEAARRAAQTILHAAAAG
ncbi:MAG TPA: TetR/AcrR family transcriptional regulator [Dactylosporangium sp.]|jgi:AcrR family transcriptional regulator|nr:TetR/AcrR family transcriptional regulator [Dactylosporangium sp.]